jgi:hypothetical protein
MGRMLLEAALKDEGIILGGAFDVRAVRPSARRSSS